MFASFADFVLHRRRRWYWLVFWPAAAAALLILWPVTLTHLTTNEQANFMQADASSLRGQVLLRAHFPQTAGARAAVVARRGEGITDADLAFLAETIRDAIEDAESGTVLTVEKMARPVLDRPEMLARMMRADPRQRTAIYAHWVRQKITNAFLISADGQVATASLKAGEFFLSKDSSAAVRRLRAALAVHRPDGLEINVTGNAAIGYDYTHAVEAGLAGTHLWALIAVMVVLVLIYRSPVAVLVPLLTIALTVVITLKIVSALVIAGMKAPSIVEAAVIVIIYGSGTDYCLFLIARFREEMAKDPTDPAAAARRAATATGPAIGASAATTAAGVALMGLSRMPTLSGCGIAMAVGLLVAMVLSLTFTPALLSLLGRALFWPMKVKRQDEHTEPGSRIWGRIGDFVTRRPGRVLVGVLILLLGFGWIVLIMPITYDTPSALAPGAESLVGMDVIGTHFRPGELGPVHVVASVPKPVARDAARVDAWAAELSERLRELPDVQDVRGPDHPFGVTHETASAWQAGRLAQLQGADLSYAVALPKARERYVSLAAEGDDRAAVRLEIVLAGRPFRLAALDAMGAIRRIADEPTRTRLGPDARIAFTGATADIADIRDTTQVDLPIIGALVLIAVLAIVFVTLRDFWMSLAMVAATALTVAATLGMTYLIFQPTGAEGVDWKVAFILFVLLIAMGVDYNIYLATRIREQRRTAALRPAVRAAIRRTGAVICSCGVVVAATFGALTATPLLLMIQWGTAMALGILLDTFLVQPLLVPAFCVLFNRLKPRPNPAVPPTK